MDFGSYSVRAGYAGEDSPKVEFPSVVGNSNLITHINNLPVVGLVGIYDARCSLDCCFFSNHNSLNRLGNHEQWEFLNHLKNMFTTSNLV